MSLVGAFMGTDQKNDVTNAKVKADAALKTGFDASQAGYTSASDRFNPWAATEGKANEMYANATGVNGQPAYQGAVANFAGDPFRQQNEDFANTQMQKMFNARGGAYGGNIMLAGERASQERGSTDWNNWLNRLQGQANPTAVGAQAGYDVGKGTNAMDYGQTQAGNEINFGNALATHENDAFKNSIDAVNAAGNVIGAAYGMPSRGNAMAARGTNNISRS